jgi:hypothetical protein
MSIESALQYVSSLLGFAPEYLTKVISFESNFDPFASNPFSGARGLLQFTNDTAKSLGYADATELVLSNPTVEAQLRGPVLKYLSQFKPFGNPFPQSLYMAVFYPAYRFSPPDTAFSDKIRSQNPGINYVSDYVSKVDRRKSSVVSVSKYSVLGFFVPAVTAALAVIYLHFKRRRYG